MQLLRVFHQLDSITRKLVEVFRDEAGFAVPDDELRPALVRNDRGDGGGVSLLSDVPVRVRFGREEENVHVRVGLGELVAFEKPREYRVVEVLFQILTLVAFTDYEELKIRLSRFQKASLQIDQHPHVLLRTQPTDRPEPELYVGGGALFGRELLGIDAAGHQVRRPSGPAGE